MGTKNNPGEFDCYAAADPDEPLFTLLARDPLAQHLVRLWASLKVRNMADAQRIGNELLNVAVMLPDPDARAVAKSKEATECAADMRTWRIRIGSPQQKPPAGMPPSTDRAIVAALEEIQKVMVDITTALNDLKTATAEAVTVEASAKTLIAGIPGLVSAAVTAALAKAGLDQQATADAAEDAAASIKAAMDDLETAIVANTPAPPASPPPPPPPPPEVTITPTSITGVAGELVRGSFSADGLTGNLTWSFLDAPPDISFSSGGSFSGTPLAAEAGDIKVSVVSDDGSTPVPIEADVTYAITEPAAT